MRIGEPRGLVEHHGDDILEGVYLPVIGADRRGAARVGDEVEGRKSDSVMDCT